MLLLLKSSILIAQDWTQVNSIGTGNERFGAVSFSIGNKGYVITGQTLTDTRKSTFEYIPDTDSWSQKADFGGGYRKLASGFTIGNKGYVVAGMDSFGELHNDLWEYDPVTDIWTQKSDYPGGNRESLISFSIGNVAYVGLGLNDGTRMLDFYKYDPADDIWTQLPDIGATAHTYAAGVFVLNGKAYYATGVGYNGVNTGYSSKVFMFDPVTESWTQKNDFNPGPRGFGVAFTVAGKAYLGLGASEIFPNDLWQYDELNDTWLQVGDFNPGSRILPSSFTMGNIAYIGIGRSPGGQSVSTFFSSAPTLSSGELTQPGFKVIANDKSITVLSEALTSYNVELFDLNGKHILCKYIEGGTAENEIPCQLGAGIYILKITQNGITFSRKLLVYKF